MTDKAEQIRNTRDREQARTTVGPLAASFTTPVVGVTFVDGYPDNILALEQLQFDAETMGEPLIAVIVREYDNEHDKNCCAIHVPALGEHGKIGCITRSLAARLSSELDSGTHWAGEIAGTRINPDHMDRPSIDVRLFRV